MKIGKNTVPSLTYSLEVEGELVDQTDESNPLVFIAGVGAMIPGFEAKLEGMAAGDEFDIVVASAEAYGEHDPKAIIPMPIDTFKVEGEIDTEVIKVGALLPMQDQNGNTLQGLITRIEAEEIIMDFNHMLAGKDLHFTGKIIEVREATAEELEHGHVHGPGGHQH